jgi:hypothetical protein
MGGSAFFVAVVVLALIGLIVLGVWLIGGALWADQTSPPSDRPEGPRARPAHVRVENDGERRGRELER